MKFSVNFTEKSCQYHFVVPSKHFKSRIHYLAFRRLLFHIQIYPCRRVLKTGQIQLLRQLTLQLLLPCWFCRRLLHFLHNETGYLIRHLVRDIGNHDICSLTSSVTGKSYLKLICVAVIRAAPMRTLKIAKQIV